MKDAETTTQESTRVVVRLKDDYKTREIHQKPVTYENFTKFMFDRDTGKPERGYGSVLPRNPLDHRMMRLITCHMDDFQYPFEWTPRSFTPEVC